MWCPDSGGFIFGHQTHLIMDGYAVSTREPWAVSECAADCRRGSVWLSAGLTRVRWATTAKRLDRLSAGRMWPAVGTCADARGPYTRMDADTQKGSPCGLPYAVRTTCRCTHP